MQCPRCGTINDNEAELCKKCYWVLPRTSAAPVAGVRPVAGTYKRTSRLAIASFVMGTASLAIIFLWPVLVLPAIICGIFALIEIKRSNGRLAGKGFAIGGIIMPSLVFIVVIPTIVGFGMFTCRQVEEEPTALTPGQSAGCCEAEDVNDVSGGQ